MLWYQDDCQDDYYADISSGTDDLNQAELNRCDESVLHSGVIEDCGASSGNVSVLFRNIKQHCIEFIDEADYILGCVAWLTDPDIIAALSRKKGVALIVQKEDFLRPDLQDPYSNDLAVDLYWRYATLHNNFLRGQTFRGTVLGEMSYCQDPTVEPVRCVGNHNLHELPAFPRMHHKFLIACDGVESGDGVVRSQERHDLEFFSVVRENILGEDHPLKRHETPLLEDSEMYSSPSDITVSLFPQKVWTGSFNLTLNSGKSFENVVIIPNKTIAHAYYKEFAQIAALSEPLDWDTPWMRPQWRIGS